MNNSKGNPFPTRLEWEEREPPALERLKIKLQLFAEVDWRRIYETQKPEDWTEEDAFTKYSIFRTSGESSTEDPLAEDDLDDLEDQPAEPIFMPRLSITDKNLSYLSNGEMVIADEEGNLSTASVDEDGALTTAPLQVNGEMIEDESIPGSKLMENTVTSRELDMEDLFSDTALLNQLIAANIDTDDLFMNDEFIGKLTDRIAAHPIDSLQIVDGAITRAKIEDAAIDQAKIDVANINWASIENLAADVAAIAQAQITTANIQEANINWADIANLVANIATIAQAQITTANIQEANINWADIENLAANTAAIAQAQITTANIREADINWAQIATLATDVAIIAKAQITTANIANADIDWASITNLAASIATIASALIDDTVIDTAQIKDGSITDGKIVSLTANKITAGEIDAANINVVNLNASNLTVGTINGQRIATDAISNEHIQNDAVCGENIAADQIVASHIHADTITGDKLVMDAITTREIATDAVLANNIMAGAITTEKIYAGAVTADTIAANAITTEKIKAGAVTTTHVEADFGKTLDLSSNTSINMKVQQITSAMDNVVKETDIEYYLSSSATTLSEGNWQTTAPEWVDGKYMWSRTKLTLVSGETRYRPSENGTCIAGATGPTGADGGDGQPGTEGRGISAITEEYYLSTSKTDRNGGAWVADPPTWMPDMYIWTRTKIEYTDSSEPTYTTPVCDSSWEAVNEIKVGSVNLVSDSETKTMTSTDNANPYWEAADQLEDGTVYTLSVREIIKNSGITAGVTWELVDTATETVAQEGMLDFAYGRQTKRFKVPDKVDGVSREWALRLYCGQKGSTDGISVTYHKVQLEEGTVATAWKASPADIAAQVSDAVNTVTEFDAAMDEAVHQLIADMGLEEQFTSVADFEAWIQTVKSMKATADLNEKDWTVAFQRLADNEGKIGKYESRIVLSDDGEPYILMSASDSSIKMRLTNTQLSFIGDDPDNPIAYFSGNKLYVTRIEAIEQFSIGTTSNGYLDISTTPTGAAFKWRS